MAPACAAAELQLYFTAIQKVVSAQVFEQDGRRYVRGSRTTKCNYAYLENARVGEAAGRLSIRARFSGRSAIDVFGRCIGLGDAFDVVITAQPACENGVIVLKDVRVESPGRDGFYIRRVRAALSHSIPADVRFPIADQAKKLFEEKRTDLPISTEMRNFQVTQIRVVADAVVLTVDFALVVR